MVAIHKKMLTIFVLVGQDVAPLAANNPELSLPCLSTLLVSASRDMLCLTVLRLAVSQSLRLLHLTMPRLLWTIPPNSQFPIRSAL